MGALFVPIVIVLIFLVAGAVALVAMSRRRQEAKEHVERPEVKTVRYRIPPGQDPAAVVSALSAAGFDAVEYATADELAVPYDSDSERARIEQVIAEAPGHLPGQ